MAQTWTQWQLGELFSNSDALRRKNNKIRVMNFGWKIRIYIFFF